MKEIKREIATLNPEGSTTTGQCAIYAQKYPRYYKEIHGHHQLITPLPIRASRYEQVLNGRFEISGSNLTVLLNEPGCPGDILCLHTDNHDSAWFFNGARWKKLEHFKPQDLPWNAAPAEEVEDA